MPSFSWTAAWLVGLVVAGSSLVALALAIVVPAVGIRRGKTWRGTGAAVSGVSLVTALSGAIAAGIYWGHAGGAGTAPRGPGDQPPSATPTGADVPATPPPRPVEPLRRFADRLDVYFEPKENQPDEARDFTCVLVTYDEGRLAGRLIREEIHERSADNFYRQLETQVARWLGGLALSDPHGHPQLLVYMQPFPGEGVFERIRQIETRHAGLMVHRVDGPWRSAFETDAPSK